MGCERQVPTVSEMLEWLSDPIRSSTIHWTGARGTGKSRVLGRVLVKNDILREIPGLVIDPTGGLISNVLDSVFRLTEEQQRAVWNRIQYIDMGNRHSVVPFPVYYQQGPDDSLYYIVQRYLNAVRTLDPHLQSASVEGYNALWQTGTYVGMVLAGLGEQIVKAPDLLANPGSWKERMTELAARQPECRPAVSWLLSKGGNNDPKNRRTTSFLQKIALFLLDPPMRAMIGAPQPGIDWQRVVDEGRTVLVDLSTVLDEELRRFLFLWVLSCFIDFVKYRGVGRHKPVTLTIDEISLLTQMDAQSGSELFALRLDELINVWARQCNVWVTLAHQEPWQLGPRMQRTMEGAGTRIIGKTSSMESALAMARQMIPADPHRVKHEEPVFDSQGRVMFYRPVYYSIEEQEYMTALKFRSLDKFQFLVKTISGEGGRDLLPKLFDFSKVEPGCYPNQSFLHDFCQLLHAGHARPVASILAELDRPVLTELRVNQGKPSAIVPPKRHDDEGFVQDEQ